MLSLARYLVLSANPTWNGQTKTQERSYCPVGEEEWFKSQMFNSGEKSIFKLTAVGVGQFLAVNPSKKNSIMIKLSSESDMFY